MGFKIINSREYREVCERVAFLESEIDGKNRDLEVKEESIKRLKKDIVALDGRLAAREGEIKQLTEALKHSNDLRDNALKEVDALHEEVARLKSSLPSKPVNIDFTQEKERPEDTRLHIEGEREPMATVRKPRVPRKPRAKKESK